MFVYCKNNVCQTATRLQNHAYVYMHNVIIKQISNNKINGNKVKKIKKIGQQIYNIVIAIHMAYTAQECNVCFVVLSVSDFDADAVVDNSLTIIIIIGLIAIGLIITITSLFWQPFLIYPTPTISDNTT